LAKYRDQLKKMKAGPAKKSVEQRALQLLKQKKMYEKQRDSVQGQVFNIDQTKFAQASLKDSADMVAAMRETHSAIKEQFAEFSVDDVEDLHDDMSELMEDTEEMNEILGRSYGVPENIDEEDLMNGLYIMIKLDQNCYFRSHHVLMWREIVLPHRHQN
jgi:charged multivesicular body protein 5